VRSFPTLSWVRLVVDDFPSSLRFYGWLMHPVGVPVEADEELEERGYARMWNSSTPNYVELELVDRKRAPELLGTDRTYDDETLVYWTVDVDSVFSQLVAEGADVVAEPFGDPDVDGRYAQVCAPDGALVELYRGPPVPSFGGALVREQRV
jgi:predicted enzyme related to lactoylglutathione lyase